MQLQKEIVSGYEIYFYETKYREIGKKILEKDYQEVFRIKDTPRNLVALISVKGKKYVLKEPRNEYRLLQRRMMSFFKKGEALTTLIQVNHLIENFDKKEYVQPYLAIVKRKKGLICYSCILMEYSQGIKDRQYLDLVVKNMLEIHKLGYYHGDCNPSNFLVEVRSGTPFIRIIDTQAKKMGITRYRAHYDMLTMKLDSYREMEYPYSEDFSYYIALFIKKMKKWEWIQFLKNKRRERRDRYGKN